ncbi:FAD-binding domain-containing protein [Daldinia decipiens]|uniref:FAD-binding domain-containing protein n=1 Tax=Daldinia decipiens TaxID=326647 RepID=UPI0020C4B862|nr:FAD-binding domain-containing protein [Daldinia decipiens]KAI1658886.1 FAD-binding domain-containing protein [Daldinia decipiens]
MALINPTTSDSQETNLFDPHLKLQVLLPGDPFYVSRQDSYWAVNSRLNPSCFVLPESSQQVSEILKALVALKRQFAIRSGGHSPVPGTNNIANAVTIDLGFLNKVIFDTDSETVSFGAGARWKGVYEELSKYKRTVAGGRGGDVGVSGLLLGGGSTWMSAKNGWACDNVLSYEIVLADGQIITADRDRNVDLFRVLKGGSNNFGIVTRFTMPTMPSDRIWGGIAASPQTAIPEVIDVMWKYTEEQAKYPDSYLMAVIGYFPNFGVNVASTALFEGNNDSSGPEFKGWYELPKLVDTTKETTIHSLSFDIALPPNYHDGWFTLCFKNDKRIMQKAAEVHEVLVEELKSLVSDGNFITQCIFQPLPTIVSKHSAAGGGNVMGIERNTDNAILFQYAAMMNTAEHAAIVYPKLRAGFQIIKDFASGIENGLMDWLYMNYADKTQDVLGSYGAENVNKMKQAAAKYDPDQVFQKLCPGGWKIADLK